MKREAPDDEHGNQNGNAKRPRSEPEDDRDDDNDDLDTPVGAASARAGGVKKGYECPYLDTISRQVSMTWLLREGHKCVHAGGRDSAPSQCSALVV